MITVKLRQAVIQTIKDSGEPEVLDVFFQEDKALDTPLPQELTVDEACLVDVSPNSSTSLLCLFYTVSCSMIMCIFHAGGRILKGSARC